MPAGAATLKELRRATADKVEPFELVRSGVEQGGTYVGTDLAARRRRLVSSDLASLDAEGVEPENPPDTYKNQYVYVCSDPPEQRRVPEGGFTGYARADEVLVGFDPALTPADTPVAYLDVERPFRAVVPPNLEVEIHGIPPLRAGKSAGLHEHIRHALNVLLREDTIQVPGTSGRTTLDVTASFPWLTMPELFISAHYVDSQPGVESWAIPGATLRFDADRTLLTTTTTIATGQTFPVRVLRPLGTWVKPSGGEWGESTTGPIADDDQVLGNTDSIALVAAFHVADAEARACSVGSAEQAYWTAQARAFAQRSPFLRDQRRSRPRAAPALWPDFVSVDGPYGGKWGPGWR